MKLDFRARIRRFIPDIGSHVIWTLSVSVLGRFCQSNMNNIISNNNSTYLFSISYLRFLKYLLPSLFSSLVYIVTNFILKYTNIKCVAIHKFYGAKMDINLIIFTILHLIFNIKYIKY